MLQAPSIHIHNMCESAQQSETHLYESDCYHYHHHERSSEVQSLIKYTSVKMEYSWCIYCPMIINDKMNIMLFTLYYSSLFISFCSSKIAPKFFFFVCLFVSVYWKLASFEELQLSLSLHVSVLTQCIVPVCHAP